MYDIPWKVYGLIVQDTWQDWIKQKMEEVKVLILLERKASLLTRAVWVFQPLVRIS